MRKDDRRETGSSRSIPIDDWSPVDDASVHVVERFHAVTMAFFEVSVVDEKNPDDGEEEDDGDDAEDVM